LSNYTNKKQISVYLDMKTLYDITAFTLIRFVKLEKTGAN